MIAEISSPVEEEAVTAKLSINGVMPINPTTADIFHKIVTGLREKNTQFYTYQLKTERALDIVLRHYNFT